MKQMTSGSRPVGLGATKLGLDVLVGFMGFSMLIATFLCLFIIVPEFLGKGSVVLFLRVEGAFVLSLVFFLIRFASRAITRHSCRELVVGALIGPFAALCMLYIPLSPELLAVAYGLAVAGLGALSSLWFCFVCRRSHRVLPIFVSAGITVGVIASLAENYLVVEAVRMTVVLAWSLSVFCLLFLMRLKPDSILPAPITNDESDKRSKILWTSALMLSISNFQFGFLLSVGGGSFERAICLTVAVIVAIFLVINFMRKGTINERSLSPLTPPLTMAGFLILYLFDNGSNLVGIAILSALFTVYSMFGIAAMAEHVRISRLSALRTYGKARFLDYLALAVGLMAGFAVADVSKSASLLAVQLTAIIAILYGFIAAYCHKARFPEMSMEGGEGRSLPETKGQWKKRCRVVSEQADLSERQFEVLVLVSQGRNARYIEQSLSISLSTAQTHIRNIYRKTGVHSRQELLNLIEDAKLYGEE